VIDRWEAVATLTDASRRALYDFVRRQHRPVAREEAAAATGMSRGLAAFHLDKLVGAGLLAAHYEAPAGRPRGRGRTPKVYELTGDVVVVTIPERHYELVADILAEAIEADQEPGRVAHRRGLEVGRGDLIGGLAALGFDPAPIGDTLVLRNCPFPPLTIRHGPLVCGLTRAFFEGVAESVPGLDAVPATEPGGCCVALRGLRPPSRD
jgi:predicted ArsR family transcriptional regulator